MTVWVVLLLGLVLSLAQAVKMKWINILSDINNNKDNRFYLASGSERNANFWAIFSHSRYTY